MAEQATTIDCLAPATLTGVVRRALGSATVEISEWQHTPLSQRSFTPATTGGLHRVSGSGRDGGQPLTWSVVLKVIQRPASPAAGELSHPDYWKREALAYESGLLDDLPVGLSAPRCFGITEPAPDVVWLWLEEVTAPFGPQWPLDRLLTAARHLGRFNGAYLAERPLPAFPWLSRGWLRSWVERTCGPGFSTLEQPGLWDHPLIAPAFPHSTGARLQRLCAERERLLATLDQLPQTLCHWDAWRPNLFARSNARGAAETGAIDWAFVGFGPVGTELGQLVALDLLTGHVSPAGVVERHAQAMGSYMAGLQEAGWRGELRAVQFGAAALIALRWTLMLPRLLGGVRDENAHAGMEAIFGAPIGALVARWGAASDFLLDQADVARRLS